MAQALLNNLNNVMTDGIYAANNSQDVVSDFGTILDAQTIEISLSENAKTEEDVQNAEEIVAEALVDVIQEAELVAAIEYVADVVTEEIVHEDNSEDTEVAQEVEEATAEEEMENEGIDGDSVSKGETEETKTIINNTITDEDPTMNTKLKATLENPTSVVIPMSQQVQVNAAQEKCVAEQSYANQNLAQAQAGKLAFLDTGKNQAKIEDVSPKSAKDLVSENMIKELNIESVNGSSMENESSGDFVKYQTPQEQAVKIMLHDVDTNFEDVKIISQKQLEATASRILEQITKQMEGMNPSSRVNIVLNPEHLGRVGLKIINSKDGLLAQFTVTNPDTQNVLLKGIAGLKESLLAQGINVDNVVIKVGESDSNESEYNPDWTEQENSNGSGHKEQGSRKNKEEKNFEQTMFEITNS